MTNNDIVVDEDIGVEEEQCGGNDQYEGCVVFTYKDKEYTMEYERARWWHKCGDVGSEILWLDVIPEELKEDWDEISSQLMEQIDK